MFFLALSVAGEESVSLPGEKISSKNIYRLWHAGNVSFENHSNQLAINVTSFQEMNHKLVKEYFYLIKKWVAPRFLSLCK